MSTGPASAAIPEPTRRRSRRSPVVQQIYDELRSLIVDLTFAPGSVLAKSRLAADFGVSPTPVREALLRLEDEGLVDIFPQSRTIVSLIDVQHAREAFFLRLSVEMEIARCVAPVISDAQIATLQALLERQDAELRAGDLSAFTHYDDRFHASVYGFAGVPGLWGLVRARQAHLDRLRRLSLPEQGKTQRIMDGHRAILDALASRDPARAEAATRGHLGATLAASDALQARHPEYFR